MKWICQTTGMALDFAPPLDSGNWRIEDHGAACDLWIASNERVGLVAADIVADDEDMPQFERRYELVNVLGLVPPDRSPSRCLGTARSSITAGLSRIDSIDDLAVGLSGDTRVLRAAYAALGS